MGHLRFLVPVLILSLLLSACGTSDPPPAASEVLTAMLTRLGVDPKTAAEDACRIEHVISEESFRAIREHIKL